MGFVYKAVGTLLLTAILVAFGLMISNNLSPIKITGFATYSGGCNSTISSNDTWQLNANLNCPSGNGITINSSNTILDCQGYTINGSISSSSSGLTINSDLSNISINNCSITNFYNPIIINSNSTLQIQNTYVTANNSCITGNWTDLGGNTGCIDTTSPTIIATNQTIYQNQSLSYQISISDNSGILNINVTDNHNFSINQSGLLTNITSLNIANYTFNITATDIYNYNASSQITISVLNSTTSSSSSSGSGSGSSGGSSSDDDEEEEEETTTKANICGVDKAWKCVSWGNCTDGIQKRTCEKIDTKCTDPLPVVKQSCNEVETLEAKECIPEWQCTYSACIEGIKTATECTDLNECGLEAPTEETCTEEEIAAQVALTGQATSPLGTIGKYANAVKSSIITWIVVILLVGGLALTIFLNKNKKKEIKSKTEEIKKDTSDKKTDKPNQKPEEPKPEYRYFDPLDAKEYKGKANASKKNSMQKNQATKEQRNQPENPSADEREKLWEWEEEHDVDKKDQ